MTTTRSREACYARLRCPRALAASVIVALVLGGPSASQPNGPHRQTGVALADARERYAAARQAFEAWLEAPTAAATESAAKSLDHLLLLRPDGCTIAPSALDSPGLRYGPNNRWGGPMGMVSRLGHARGRPDAAVAAVAKWCRTGWATMRRDEAHGADFFAIAARTYEQHFLPRHIAQAPWLRDLGRVRLVAFADGFLFVRPAGDRLQVSLRDVAFTLGNDPASNDASNWTRAWQVDWEADRFTLLYAGHRLTFTAGSTEALLDGEPRVLRRAPERVHYDLYVLLADLAELLGGAVREAREDELTVYREHLPVTIDVLDLPDG